MNMASAYWTLEQIDDDKFPYRLSIVQAQKTLLALYVQEKWPGTKGQIFCIREDPSETIPSICVVEKVPVVSLNRYGKRLAIVLDRNKNKRCDFLFLKKRYKTKDGEYEQIFWRTQNALSQRRPKVKLSLYGSENMNIVIDSNERYSWKFSGHNIEKSTLPGGDYALLDHSGQKILAIVERKTFDNLVSNFGNMPVVHQKLGELEAYPHAALVVEASYSDFLSPSKQSYYKAGFASKAIAELQVMHPGLTIIFAGNRKLANQWVYAFFAAVKSHYEDLPEQFARDVISEYKSSRALQDNFFSKQRILAEMPDQFSFLMVKEHFTGVSKNVLQGALKSLKAENKLLVEKDGKLNIWTKGRFN